MSDTTDYDLKLAELKINGYVIFEDLIAEEMIDRIRDAFMPLLEHVRERESEIHPIARGDVRTGLGRMPHLQRYTVTVPWVLPFADPALFEHPIILEFLDRYWGRESYEIAGYDSNNPYPGSDHQIWHRDTNLGTEVPHLSLNSFPVLAFKFPLVDTSEENGSIEILPGSQYIADPDMEGQYSDILLRGQFPSAHRLNLKKGSAYIQDPRILHRGTPNRSSGPRPEVGIAYCKSWYTLGVKIDLSYMDCSTLSERAEKMLWRWLPGGTGG